MSLSTSQKELKRIQTNGAHKKHNEDSVNFRCTFANTTQDVTIADTGAEINLMGSNLLKRIVKDNGSVQISKLDTPMEFKPAVINTPENTKAKILYHRKVTIPIELHVGHATGLLIRNITWAARQL